MLDLALRALAAVVARFPEGARVAFGAALGWLAGSVLRIRRAQVEAAMTRAGITSPRREAAGMYRSLGQGVFELLGLAGGGARELDAAIAFDDRSRAKWDAARRVGRGIVVAASHTGNWELAASALAREGDLVAIVKRISVRGFDAFCNRLRARRGVGAALPDGALARGRATLASGGIVVMVIDQVPDSTRHASRVDFLGAPAYADRAPAALAARSGAPIVVAACRRDGRGHTIEVLDVIVPPPRPSRTWIETATCDATRALDRFVRAHPRDWLWLHRRWRVPARG